MLSFSQLAGRVMEAPKLLLLAMVECWVQAHTPSCYRSRNFKALPTRAKDSSLQRRKTKKAARPEGSGAARRPSDFQAGRGRQVERHKERECEESAALTMTMDRAAAMAEEAVRAANTPLAVERRMHARARARVSAWIAAEIMLRF
ncbi:hypothetical protein HPB50_018860 [Hyalomma asiaticum]|uniref:Uncharacterized protein n=1 Tax=Hyalomma asiaticum TaxID=266040 RepID=A0ACB7S7L2_HYAAI|nr:hypothetical protein HPB50_018860 [Hyalomma asiaticum]